MRTCCRRYPTSCPHGIPSQLYQAFAEGPVLALVLWIVWARPKRSGTLACVFLIVYGICRVIIEQFFRLPDPQLQVQRILGLSRRAMAECGDAGGWGHRARVRVSQGEGRRSPRRVVGPERRGRCPCTNLTPLPPYDEPEEVLGHVKDVGMRVLVTGGAGYIGAHA